MVTVVNSFQKVPREQITEAINDGIRQDLWDFDTSKIRKRLQKRVLDSFIHMPSVSPTILSTLHSNFTDKEDFA